MAKPGLFFVYIRSFLTLQTNIAQILTINDVFGSRTRAAGSKAQTNPLSYGAPRGH